MISCQRLVLPTGKIPGIEIIPDITFFAGGYIIVIAMIAHDDDHSLSMRIGADSIYQFQYFAIGVLQVFRVIIIRTGMPVGIVEFFSAVLVRLFYYGSKDGAASGNDHTQKRACSASLLIPLYGLQAVGIVHFL